MILLMVFVVEALSSKDAISPSVLKNDTLFTAFPIIKCLLCSHHEPNSGCFPQLVSITWLLKSSLLFVLLCHFHVEFASLIHHLNRLHSSRRSLVGCVPVRLSDMQIEYL